MSLYKYLKRTSDIILSLATILILLPLLLILSVICAVDTHTSPLFFQNRVGKNGKIFKIIKFRTMKISAPSHIPARAIKDDSAFVSRFGAWLRKSGLDELPQLFNIFIGQMSFVGPRPLMLSEKVLHRERSKLGVYNATPGLTGLAQINCDSINSVKEKAELDARYTNNITLCTDIKIIFSTFTLFFKGKHIDEHFNSPSE